MLQTSGLFLSAHADRPVISTGTPHVTASQTNISAPRRQSRRQVPEKEKKGLGMLPRPRFADRARFELAEAFTSHAFEACSLDRSDTYPLCYLKTSNFIILPQLWRLSNPIEGFLRCLRLLGVSYSREHCVALCEDGCADSVRKSALCE